MKMVNILQCKVDECINNSNGDCTLEAIVIDSRAMCDDYDNGEE